MLDTNASNDEEYAKSDFQFFATDDLVVDNNENKNSVFVNKNKETPENLKKWLLFDTASTTHLVSNKKLVNNIKNKDNVQNIISNGGELKMH